MEKSFSLDQKEHAALAGLEQERTQALAAIGALMLDLEQARKNLDGSVERQKAFIRQSLAARGIERFDNARLVGGSVVVSLPDEPMGMMPTLVPPNGPNGAMLEQKG